MARDGVRHHPKAMPRFYFDTCDGRRLITDDEGINLSGLSAAKRAAADAVATLSRGVVPVDGRRLVIWVAVRDEYGRTITKASAAFEMRDEPLN